MFAAGLLLGFRFNGCAFFTSSFITFSRWKVTLPGWVDGSPTISPDGTKVFVIAGDGSLYAIDTITYDVLWSYPSCYNLTQTKPLVSTDGMVVYALLYYSLSPPPTTPLFGRNSPILLVTSARCPNPSSIGFGAVLPIVFLC